MSIDLFLIIDESCERFELGSTKSGFQPAFEALASISDEKVEGFFLPDTDTLASFLVISANENGSWDNKIDFSAHIKRAAAKMTSWAAGRKVRFITESSNEFIDKDMCLWPITGSRYDNKDMT